MIRMDELLNDIVTNLTGVFLGLLLIFGAWRKWSFLVSPTESLWPIYSQSLMKKFFGSRGAAIFCYLVGVLIVVVAGALAIKGLFVLGQGLGYWDGR